MTTTATPKAGFELHRDEWLASIIERPAARLRLHGCDLPNLNELKTAIDAKTWLAAETWNGDSCFVDCKLDASRLEQVNGLHDLGMKVVDVNVTSELVLSFGEPFPPSVQLGIEVISSENADSQRLADALDIAATSFRYSRFHLDRQLDDAIANRIKRDWLDSCICGRRGDKVWIALDPTGRTVGFLASIHHASDQGEVAIIDLIAVGRETQARGVGRALTQAFLSHYASMNVSRFRVGTQVANVPAQRLYQSLGFKTVSSTFVMHGHFR